MRFLHRLSTPRLIAVIAAVVALAGGTAAIAVAATGGGGPTPPPKALAPAIHDALAAPKAAGLSAHIAFTNDLIGASSLREGASPILTGATGRLWLGDGGKLRLELQSSAGDAQIVSDGRRLQVFDASSNTIYETELPASEEPASADAHVPTVADIQKHLNGALKSLDVSGPTPGNVAGRPAYTVRIAPQHDGGLLGAAEVAWDAANGTPLRAAVYAQGSDDPVLELKVTGISYGPVAASTFAMPDAPGAKVVHLSATPMGGSAQHSKGAEVSGRDAVASELGFPLAAPDQLVGLPRHDVRLIDSGGEKAALVTYGKGLGGIVVIEQAASGDDPLRGRDSAFPSVSIDGATGMEIATALGTVVRFTRGPVTYTVLGSVPPAAAEAAARAL